jgi:coenzyme F420-reducing hydrogenase alpha subunit
MTPDETRNQKALLLLEYQEAEQQVADLEEKAARIAERIGAVSQWLKTISSNREIHPSDIPVWIAGAKADIFKDSQFAAAMNLEDARKLVQEIIEARERLSDLTRRKQVSHLK